MNNVKEEYLLNAVDELFSEIGIRESLDSDNFLSSIKKLNLQEQVEFIAKHLGLPIKINIISGNNFSSKDLVFNQGQSFAGVSAQVFIPGNLPMYGSKEFTNFKIDIKIQNNLQYRDATFISVLSHELSHVLLYSIRNPQKENEFYTDITSMILGFSNIVSNGRKVLNYTIEKSDSKIENTTTYGYLNDYQFYKVKSKIDKKILEYKKWKIQYKKEINIFVNRLNKIDSKIFLLKNFFNYLTKNITRTKINSNDSNLIKTFYNKDYFNELNTDILVLKNNLEQTEKEINNLNHYFKNTKNIFNDKLVYQKNKINNLYNTFFINFNLFKKYIPIHAYILFVTKNLFKKN